MAQHEIEFYQLTYMIMICIKLHNKQKAQ